MTITEIIADQLCLDSKDIDPNVTLESLGADSLDTVLLTSNIEDAFNIDIPDNTVRTSSTVNDLQALITNEPIA